MHNRIHTQKRPSYLVWIIGLVVFWSFYTFPWSEDLVHGGGLHTMLQIGSAMLHPNLSYALLRLGLLAAVRTLVYAFAGLSVALILGFSIGLSASQVLGSRSPFSPIRIFLSRRLLGFMRAIHELVWALLFVATIGLSPIAGVLALGIPYGGMLGRIWADLLDNVDPQIIASLKSSGANKWQVLFYGYLPIALPDMISYTLYRLECGIRSSAVMSFVGLGGLGYQIQLSLSDLAYAEVWTFLYLLILLILGVDQWSRALRRRLSYGM